MLQVADALRSELGEGCVVHGKKCPPGKAWHQGYFEWLSRAKVVLVLLSPNYFGSDACKAEFEEACTKITPDDDSRVVIPVIVQSLRSETNPKGYPTEMLHQWKSHSAMLGRRNCFPAPSEGTLMDNFEVHMQTLMEELLHVLP